MAINYGKLPVKMTPRGVLKANLGVSGPLNSDYEPLINKPQINGNTLIGNKTNAELGIPTSLAEMTEDEEHRTVTDTEKQTWDNKSDFSGSYNDLEDKPDIPDELSDLTDDSTHRLVTDTEKTAWNAKAETSDIHNSTITIQKNSQNIDSFTLNQDSNKSINIAVPTKTSDIQNDNGFIVNTVNNLANYYLKSETYTQTEVNNLISAAVNGRFEKVTTLPASGEPNVIYLVPKTTTQTNNVYDEYIWQDNAWELIGSTEIDLSGYVTTTDLATALQSYLTTSAFNTVIANYYNKTEVGTLLDNKVDKIPGKGLSTNDYDNTAKAIVDSVTANLATKVDKVPGKGLSTNDYDNTAKSIVDGVTSALAGKVDKVDGKGLSTNDYTTEEQTKLAGISEGANKVEQSETNGNIVVDGTEIQVYDDTDITDAISDMGEDIEDIQDELSTDSATVEGNPINFTTLSAQTAQSTILSCEPIQDLHGYDKPWVGGAGKNLLPLTVSGIKALNTGGTWSGNVYTVNTATFTLLTDSDNNITGIKINGTPTGGNADLYIGNAYASSSVILPSSSSYIASIDNSNIKLFVGYSNTWSVNTSSSILIESQNISWMIIRASSGQSISNQIIHPMIRLSTVTDATFEPYTNIAAISGRSEVDILGCGKNLFDSEIILNGTQYLTCNEFNVKPGTYRLIFKNNSNAQMVFWATSGYDIADTSSYTVNSGNTANASYTVSGNGNVKFGFRHNPLDSNVSVDDIKEPMFILASETDTSYEPYTKSNDLTIQLGQTVYGGTLDVENGVLTIAHVVDTTTWGDGTNATILGNNTRKRLPNLSYIPKTNDGISNVAPYLQNWDSDITHFYIQVNQQFYCFLPNDTDNDTQIQVCYELATPITINLTPNQISLLEGVNNISVDDDFTTIILTYRDGSVATLEDVKLATENLETQIADAQILTDTVTGDKYKLVITNGVLDIQQVSN